MSTPCVADVISMSRWSVMRRRTWRASEVVELIEFALQLPVARDTFVDTRPESFHNRRNQQIEEARDRRERIPELADVGFHLQQIAVEFARPRTIDVGDEREGQAAARRGFAIAARDLRVSARVGDDQIR